MAEIRMAGHADLAALTALCLKSKAVWGYDAAFMRACVAELTLTSTDLAESEVVVIDGKTGPVAMAQVAVGGESSELLKLFVHPDAMGSGHGRRLFDWAVATARAAGAKAMTIEADPDAVPFYAKMGAVEVGRAPSGSIPGRELPCLRRGL